MGNSNDKNTNKKGGGFRLFNIFWMYVLIGLALVGLFYFQNSGLEKEVGWSDFEKYVETKGVTKIVVYPQEGKINAYMTDSLAKVVFNKEVPERGASKKWPSRKRTVFR